MLVTQNSALEHKSLDEGKMMVLLVISHSKISMAHINFDSLNIIIYLYYNSSKIYVVCLLGKIVDNLESFVHFLVQFTIIQSFFVKRTKGKIQ